MGRVTSSPQKSMKVKNAPKPKRVKHSDVKDATKAAVESRNNAMERALKAAERGSPGRPARTAPRVAKMSEKGPTKNA